MSFAYSSVSGVNDETGVTFVSGYTGPCSLDPAARIRAKSSFHIRDALYALSLLAAESMGLKLNRQFFPGSFPKSGQETVFSLEFLPDDEYNNTAKLYRSPRPKAAGRTNILCKRHTIFWFRITSNIFPVKWERAARPAVRDGRFPSR